MLKCYWVLTDPNFPYSACMCLLFCVCGLLINCHFLFPSGLHEQHFIWQWEDRLLWDSCRGSRGGARLEWAEWSSQSHDQHSHHWPRDSGEEVGHVLVSLNLLCLLIIDIHMCVAAVHLVLRYPVVLEQFTLRPDSGGAGKYCGGDGVTRKLLFRSEVVLSVLTERRTTRPYGIQGKLWLFEPTCKTPQPPH